MKMTLATQQDCEDFVRGLTFLGTGGGGAPERGLKLLLEKLDAGAAPGWVSIDDLPPDTWTATVAGLGGRPPKDGPPQKELELLGLSTPLYDNTLPVALRELAQYAGVEIGAVVPGEVGAGNSTVPMITAAAMGIQTVDGDYAGGRSIPELSQTTPEVFGKSLFPVVMVDRWGDISIIKAGASAQMADRIGRMLAAAAYGGVAFACLLMQAKEAKTQMNPGSMSQALQIGRILRQARERGDDPANEVVKQHDGWVLFRGEVTASVVEDKEAYMFGYGTHHLRGVDEFARHTFRIWYKNEYHVSWLDDQPYVMSPDAMAVIDLSNGEPHVNNSIAAGQRVAVVGRQAAAAHRTARGVEVLGPRHFGFELDYIPIEQKVR